MNYLSYRLTTIFALFTFALPIHASDLIIIDGSSTVFPITNSVAKSFVSKAQNNTKVVVGITGTGGGFRKFCRGETDISNASRPIKEKEKANCAAHGVEFIEIPVALDALTVVVNKSNDWVESMTIEELRMAWRPESEGVITSWHMLNSEYPDLQLDLHGPGIDSGTYDYFVNAIVEQKESRKDYTPNEDDHVIASNVARNVNALAYFGYAYYEKHKDTLKAVPISWKGRAPVAPK